MAITITNPNTQIRLPSQYSMTSVILSTTLHKTELDISQLVVDINIFESVLGDVLSGNITIRDTENYISTFPICGYETVSLQFSARTEDKRDSFSVSFRVYSITNVIEITGGGKTYRLELISPEFLTTSEMLVSRAFQSQTASQIVNTLWKDTIQSEKPLKIEETSGLLDVVIPSWKPLKTLKWLCGRAMSVDREGSNYFFYETLDGFNFVSLETLVADIDDTEIITYYYGTRDMPSRTGGPTPTAAYTVTDIQVDSSFDLIQNLSLGMYSNTMIEHDIVKREYKINRFDYEKSFDKYEHLEDWSFLHGDDDTFKEVYDSRKFLVPSSRDSSKKERTIQARVSQLQQINTYKITLTLPGNIATRAGDVVYLYYPAKSSEGVEDHLMSGHYLVLSVKNNMSMTSHQTTIEIVKDSYFKEIPIRG